jgi:hypothetical protein
MGYGSNSRDLGGSNPLFGVVGQVRGLDRPPIEHKLFLSWMSGRAIIGYRTRMVAVLKKISAHR